MRMFLIGVGTTVITSIFSMISGPCPCTGENRYPEKYKQVNTGTITMDNFLHIEGKKVVDKDGNEVFLRGVNLGAVGFVAFKDKEFKGVYSLERITEFNMKLINCYVTESDIKELKNIGANVIRFCISFYDLETEPYKYNDGVLKQMDYLVELCSRYGIYVIPVLGDAAQNSVQPINKRLYNGVLHMWIDDEWNKRVIAVWEYIAKHYADNPGIAGYDIINEPSPPTKKAFHTFYSNVIKTIRKVDKNHIIILAKNHFGNPNDPENRQILFGGKYDDKNIMWTTHYYEDESLKKRTIMPEVNYSSYEKLEKMIKEGMSGEEVKDCPLFVGEFGAVLSAKDSLRWIGDLMDVMNKHNIHYAYWLYKNQYPPYHTWDRYGLYQAKKELFPEIKNMPVPKDQIIEYVEKRLDKLLISNFQISPELKHVLGKGFKR